MDRKEKILNSINKEGLGLEIGPSHSPVAPKKEGFNVEVIDTHDRDGLIKRYKELDIDVDNIEEVDYVWNGKSYAELTGKANHYDWILASHVIEHVPDLIGFLLDCAEVLKDDGVLTLAVPDKRYCFDHFRPISTISQVIDRHLSKTKINTPGTVAEYHLNVAFKSEVGAWAPPNNSDDEYRLVHSTQDAINTMNAVINDNTYLDVHAWCFVPHSFRLMIQDLFNLGLIPFQEVDFFPAVGCEFYVALSKNGSALKQSRLALLKTIEEEVKELA